MYYGIQYLNIITKVYFENFSRNRNEVSWGRGTLKKCTRTVWTTGSSGRPAALLGPCGTWDEQVPEGAKWVDALTRKAGGWARKGFGAKHCRMVVAWSSEEVGSDGVVTLILKEPWFVFLTLDKKNYHASSFTPNIRKLRSISWLSGSVLLWPVFPVLYLVL